jgi:hypothetical protein
MDRPTVIISGASNTAGVWPTWADIVQRSYAANFVNIGKKGLGNEAIILRALSSAWSVKPQSNIVILIMLTTIDKWDWYIDSPDLLEKFNKEKHTITKLQYDSTGGFWCTGSWFPLEKELYYQNYYNEDYFTLKSLQMLSMFKQVCQQNNWKYHITFDSPIWSMTEKELTQKKTVEFDKKLIKTQLCQWLYNSSCASENVYEPGLIGFLHQINHPWFSKTLGAHPGSLGHLLFTKEHVFPFLNNFLLSRHNLVSIEKEIHLMNRLWTP